jgi:hypothetical protein
MLNLVCSWRWGRISPERCEACGAWRMPGILPTWRRFGVDDAVGMLWRWAFWFGPLHVRREWPDDRKAMAARIESHNAATRR